MIRQKRSGGRIFIGEKERALFSYLYEQKMATSRQIHRDIYPTYEFRSVQNRLTRLVGHRLITRRVDDSLGCTMAYHLSRKGFQQFIEPLGENLRAELASHSVAHDLDLVDIRHVLSKVEAVKNYYPENTACAPGLVDFSNKDFSLGNLKPDAVVEIEFDRRLFTLALEYETSRKFADRYKNLFRRYYQNRTIAGVLYICSDQSLLSSIKNIEKKEMSGSHEVAKIYYSDYSTWTHENSILFTNLAGHSLELQL